MKNDEPPAHAPFAVSVTRKQGDLTTLRGGDGLGPQVPEPELSVVAVSTSGAKSMPIARGSSLVLGRAHPADLVVVDASLSRQHARISVSESGEVEVEDLGSTNGTFSGGKRVQRARILVGEAVRAGDVTVVVQPGRGAPSPSGIEGYDRFTQGLEQELLRAKTFARPVALVRVRVSKAAGSSIERFAKVTALLRPVDRLGLYAASELHVLLPEAGAEAARALAQRLVAELPGASVDVACFPENGTSSDELVDAVRGGQAPRSREAGIVDSPAMREVRGQLARLAASELPVLLLGETGVGKELLARQVHEGSPRRKGPFQAVNCAAVAPALLESALFGHERGAFTGAEKTTRGVFELAHGGTLFLDEVGELSPPAQAALLRVLETRTLVRVGSEKPLAVDVRVVAATHRDLDAMVERGEFRQDLLYRLEGASLRIPPLRARLSEVLPLARLFLEEANRTNGRALPGFDAEAEAAFHAYPWPGNVRELKNAVARAAVIAEGERITLADLPERVRRAVGRADASLAPSIAPGASAAPQAQARSADPIDFKERVRAETRALETQLIVDALRANGGNQTAAAKALGMPIRTLAHKMKELGIKGR